MSMRKFVAAGLALVLAAGCAPPREPGEGHPEARQRGLDSMMVPGGGAYLGGSPGQGAGRFLGPGLNMMPPTVRGQPLTAAEVTNHFNFRLARYGDGSVMLGTVSEKDMDTISVEIVTLDGVPVARYEVDRKAGIIRRVR